MAATVRRAWRQGSARGATPPAFRTGEPINQLHIQPSFLLSRVLLVSGLLLSLDSHLRRFAPETQIHKDALQERVAVEVGV